MIDDIRKIKEDQNLNSPNTMDVDNFLALSLLIKILASSKYPIFMQANDKFK